MIKLSDYLDYLNTEVIQARKKADEEAIRIAKEYAKHEYLKYFKVPRFSMPSVKMSIPIKIAELEADTKYNFKMDDASFLSEVNSKIATANKEKNLDLKPITPEFLKTKNFVGAVKKLESHDYKYVKKLDDSLSKVQYGQLAEKVTGKLKFGASNADNKKTEETEFNSILKDAFKSRYRPVSAQLNDIFIDPDTTKESDKGKVLLTLDVEMEEDGIRIREVKDKDGNVIEEIVFE